VIFADGLGLVVTRAALTAVTTATTGRTFAAALNRALATVAAGAFIALLGAGARLAVFTRTFGCLGGRGTRGGLLRGCLLGFGGTLCACPDVENLLQP
jgi:hypothetical protein